MLFREGSREWEEEQWEKLCQALPASPKQPQMKSPSVGEDSPPISTLPQFLWKHRTSLGGKMPGHERYGEGLRIAAGAGNEQVSTGSLSSHRVMGRGWSSPALPRRPERRYGRERGVARPRVKCWWCP